MHLDARGDRLTGSKPRVCAILLSEDANLTQVVRELALQFDFEIDAYSELADATPRIAVAKYHGILVDWRSETPSRTLINAVRGSTSNNSDIVFAFIASGDQALSATRAGANFLVPLPATLESITPYFRVAYGLMVHELRRYLRVAAVWPVQLESEHGASFRAETLNVSSGGIAVVATERLSPGESLLASFVVPGSGAITSIRVSVCWADALGRAGLRFEKLPEEVSYTIQQWLASKLDELLPTF